MAKCERCGKEFKTEHALKVHTGIQHGSGKVRRRRKGGRKAKAQHVCPDCGRGFAMSMHLARHRAVAHPASGGRRGQAQAAVVSGVNIDSLMIDQLLSLRSAIDSKLTSIARLMRQAKIRI
jgi:uncharacterized C2H2 Zn-finger protein